MRVGGSLVAVIVLILSAALDGSAQSPPARVYGSVTVNGSAPPPGTVVEAYVGSRLCGSGEVRDLGAPIGIGFVVDVNSDAFLPGCAREGTTVSFRVGGLDAAETVTFQTGAFIQQNLTARGQPASPSPATATPPPSPSPTPPPTASPAPSPAATAPPSASPSAGPSPEGSPSPSPEAAGVPSPASSPSPSLVPDTAVRTPAPAGNSSGEGSDGGVPSGVWLALGAGVLAAAGTGAYLYLRNHGGPTV